MKELMSQGFHFGIRIFHAKYNNNKFKKDEDYDYLKMLIMININLNILKFNI